MHTYVHTHIHTHTYTYVVLSYVALFVGKARIQGLGCRACAATPVQQSISPRAHRALA